MDAAGLFDALRERLPSAADVRPHCTQAEARRYASALERMGRAHGLSGARRWLRTIFEVVLKLPDPRHADSLAEFYESIARAANELAGEQGGGSGGPPPLAGEALSAAMPGGVREEEPGAISLPCAVCCEYRTQMRINVGCGHLALCDVCCDAMLRGSGPKGCVICRRSPGLFAPVYLSGRGSR